MLVCVLGDTFYDFECHGDRLGVLVTTLRHSPILGTLLEGKWFHPRGTAASINMTSNIKDAGIQAYKNSRMQNDNTGIHSDTGRKSFAAWWPLGCRMRGWGIAKYEV